MEKQHRLATLLQLRVKREVLQEKDLADFGLSLGTGRSPEDVRLFHALA
jgi:hypothetical protein